MTTELNANTLEWAAQWLEGSIKGESNERVREFAGNMAMTFRAAKLPPAATPVTPPLDDDSCSHWREGDSDNCVLCGDDLGPTTEADVAVTSPLLDAARKAADDLERENFLLSDITPQEREQVAAIISRYVPSARPNLCGDVTHCATCERAKEE